MSEAGTHPMDEHLTHRQRLYAENIARGLDSPAAAKSAGYSDSFAKVAAYRLGKKPEVAQAIASIQTEGRRLACYDVTVAMREANDAAAFARANKNSMALVKAVELRAKLSGLLIDRVEVVAVDLTGALQRAEARVLNTPGASSSRGSIDWRPQIPGSQEPGSGNGQAER